MTGGDNILPLEVKYKNEIGQKDLKNILRFCGKFNVKSAIVITKGQESGKRFKHGKLIIDIQLIPAWKWLLN